MKTALITGISGQVGSYLAEYLLEKDYRVYGIKRRSSSFNTERIDHLFNNPNLELMYGDVTDFSSLNTVISKIKPDEMYNLAYQSHVKVSFEIPIYTTESGQGTLHCLEAIRQHSPKTKFLNSGSSEQFGNSKAPQNEQTPCDPKSPYAVGKVASYHMTKLYREAYNLFSVSSICFNMESPRRGPTFATRKITRAATRIKLGLQDKLILGNLNAKRDWQFAGDAVRAMHLMLQAEFPQDYVIGTGEMRSVQEFLEIVFKKLDLDWKQYVSIDQKYFRAAEVHELQADYSKIKNELGWAPQVSFDKLIDEMIKSDLKLAKQELLLKGKDD